MKFNCTLNAIFTGIFMLAALLCTSVLTAQKVELRANFNTGLFSFGGKDAASTSWINNETATNNPYGRKSGLSYGLSLNLRKVTPSLFLYGIDAGYEMLQSKVNLKYSGVIMGDIASDFVGRTHLNNSFINAFPFMGKRFLIGGWPVDLMGGLDVAFLLKSREKGSAHGISNVDYHTETDVDRKNINTDLRPRLQLSTDISKVGVNIGYSYGLMNYRKGLLGADREVYSRMLRIGLSYRLN